MNTDVDAPIVLSEIQASQGVKLGSVRYVLGISLAMAVGAGIVLWFFFAK